MGYFSRLDIARKENPDYNRRYDWIKESFGEHRSYAKRTQPKIADLVSYLFCSCGETFDIPRPYGSPYSELAGREWQELHEQHGQVASACCPGE